MKPTTNQLLRKIIREELKKVNEAPGKSGIGGNNKIYREFADMVPQFENEMMDYIDYLESNDDPDYMNELLSWKDAFESLAKRIQQGRIRRSRPRIKR